LAAATSIGDGRTTRSTTPPSTLPIRFDPPRRTTRTIVTGDSVMSPFSSKPKEPRSPSRTRVSKSSSMTDERVPSECAIASRREPGLLTSRLA
jgi:hypothetical protein